MDPQELQRIQATLRDAELRGAILPSGELIEGFEILGNAFLQLYETGSHRGHSQYLRYATENRRNVLRLLPKDSPDRPLALGKLSYVLMSEYLASMSQHSIDEAIRLGEMAEKEAISRGLPESDMMAYYKILTHVGFALSSRSQQDLENLAESSDSNNGTVRKRAAGDLDEAIRCARKIRELTPPERGDYLPSLINLASRVEARYTNFRHPDDHTEAVALLNEVVSLAPPESSPAAMAMLHLGRMAFDRSKESGNLQDLDEAISQLKQSLKVLGLEFDARPGIHDLLITLYGDRFKKTCDLMDLRHALNQASVLLVEMPSSYGIRDRYIHRYVTILQQLAGVVSSADEISSEIYRAQRYYHGRNKQSTRYLEIEQALHSLLGRLYYLSRSLEHLLATVTQSRILASVLGEGHEHFATNLRGEEVLSRFKNVLGDLVSLPPSSTKDSIGNQLYEYIESMSSPGAFATDLKNISMEIVLELEIYADTLSKGKSISEAEVKAMAIKKARDEEDKLKQVKQFMDRAIGTEISGRRQQRSSRYEQQLQQYRTEFGLRSLAIDPTNSRLIMDLSVYVGNVFGVDASKPMSRSEFIAHLQKCETDSLEKARAAGRRPNMKLCYMCRLVKPLQPILAWQGKVENGFVWEPVRGEMPFGNWQQLYFRENCSICRLILSLIISDPVSKNLHPRLASIDYEVQGVNLRALVSQKTGEDVLRINYGLREVGMLRFVRQDTCKTALRQGWEVNTPSWFKTVYSSSQQVNLELIKKWFNECMSNHGDECNGGNKQSSNAMREIPLFLIDAVDNCLVRSTSSAKYFALSYTWGKVDMSPTLVANVKARLEKNGLPQDFPKTIADGITFVRSLGERYIWIDAICIVQDDAKQKMEDIAAMDVIYSQAFATLVALHGTDADSGLPGVRPRTRPPQQLETLMIERGNHDLDCDPDPLLRSGAEVITQFLTATPPPLHLVLETSRWNTRGWTFQERLLSRRCLYFGERYVYFQCRGSKAKALSECDISGPFRAKQGFWDADREHRKASTALDNPLSDILQDSVAQLTKEIRQRKTFVAYKDLVSKYTTRELTNDGDIINAFLGTYAVFESAFQCETLCGLPAAVFDLALLWTPNGKTTRRGTHESQYIMTAQNTKDRPRLPNSIATNRGTCEVVFGPTEVQTFDTNVDRRFPSWTWAGWKGQVEYRFFETLKPNETFPKSLIVEFSTNLDGKELKTIEGRRQSEHPETDMDPSVRHSNSDPLESNLSSLNLHHSNLKSELITAPTLPNVLQFVAPVVPLTAFMITQDREYISRSDQIHAASSQPVRHITDQNHNRCGLWWEQAGYMYVGRGVSPNAEKKMILVGISRQDEVTFGKIHGPNRAEGEISLNAVGGVVNVIAVDLDMGHDYGERITVARISARAWDEAKPVMQMVKLA